MRLATIHGYGRLLDLERLPEDYRPFVPGIRQETEALGQVVTNFLNFAKPTQLTLTPADMTAVITRVVDDIRPEVQSRGGELFVRGHFAQRTIDPGCQWNQPRASGVPTHGESRECLHL